MRAISTTNRISMKNWFVRPLNSSKRLTSVTNCAFSVQHGCGLSTTPTLLACADATAHAQAQCRKGRQVIKQLAVNVKSYHSGNSDSSASHLD